MHARPQAAVRALFCAVIAATLGACAAVQSNSDHAAARTVIDGYFAALNRRDLLALTAYVAPDFQWLSLVNGERIVEVESREALAQSLRSHFKQHEFFRWTIVSADAIGSAMAVIERSEWREADAPQTRLTLGVFELRDGRIRRVTYFLED